MTIGIILLVVSFAELILGIWFLTRYQKNQATMWYGLFAIAAAMYVGSNGLGYVIDSFYIAERGGWIGGMLTAFLFLPFSYSFPFPKRTTQELLPWALLPALVFVSSLAFTNLFIKTSGIVNYGEGYQTDAGPYLWVMLTVFGLYWIWAIRNLFVSFGQADGIHRWQLKMIIIGIFSSLIVATIFDIITPLYFTSQHGYVGSLFTSVWLGFTSYILVRK